MKIHSVYLEIETMIDTRREKSPKDPYGKVSAGENH